jgi:hypothetical protein
MTPAHASQLSKRLVHERHELIEGGGIAVVPTRQRICEVE